MDVNSDFDRSRRQQSYKQRSKTVSTEMPISSPENSFNSGIFQLMPGIHYVAPPASPPVVRGLIDPNSFYGIYLRIMLMPRYNRDRTIQERLQRVAFDKLMELELNIASSGLGTSSLENKLGNCKRLQEVNIPIGIKNVSSLIYRQPQNSILFRWLFCSINSSYLTVNKVNEVKYDWHIDIYELQNVIKAINLISEKGYYGQVWNTAIRGLERLAYIKTSKTSEDDTIRHEFFIGYYLNEMRDTIPNFMYVYGMFSCKDKENNCFNVPTLRNDNNTEYTPANYLIMESVKPGYPPIFETILDYNFEQFMSIYLQIICAVGMAYEKYDFSHNDLHEGNILLQDLPEGKPVLIEYTLGENRFYIKSYVIVKIIDYGLAHIRIKDEQQHPMNFGNMISPKVDFTRSTPTQDIYFITGRLLRSLKESRRGLLPYVHNIITDFVEFNLYDTLERSGFNEASFSDQLEIVDFLNFAGPFNPPNVSPFNHHLNHILERYRYLRNSVLFDHPTGGARILTCGKNDQCANINEINSIATSNQLI